MAYEIISELLLIFGGILGFISFGERVLGAFEIPTFLFPVFVISVVDEFRIFYQVLSECFEVFSGEYQVDFEEGISHSCIHDDERFIGEVHFGFEVEDESSGFYFGEGEI